MRRHNHHFGRIRGSRHVLDRERRSDISGKGSRGQDEPALAVSGEQKSVSGLEPFGSPSPGFYSKRNTIDSGTSQIGVPFVDYPTTIGGGGKACKIGTGCRTITAGNSVVECWEDRLYCKLTLPFNSRVCGNSSSSVSRNGKYVAFALSGGPVVLEIPTVDERFDWTCWSRSKRTMDDDTWFLLNTVLSPECVTKARARAIAEGESSPKASRSRHSRDAHPRDSVSSRPYNRSLSSRWWNSSKGVGLGSMVQPPWAQADVSRGSKVPS